jgi:hypothetical protein
MTGKKRKKTSVAGGKARKKRKISKKIRSIIILGSNIHINDAIWAVIFSFFFLASRSRSASKPRASASSETAKLNKKKKKENTTVPSVGNEDEFAELAFTAEEEVSLHCF